MCSIFRSNLIALLPARNPKIHQMYKIISMNDLKKKNNKTINEIFIFENINENQSTVFFIPRSDMEVMCIFGQKL